MVYDSVSGNVTTCVSNARPPSSLIVELKARGKSISLMLVGSSGHLDQVKPNTCTFHSEMCEVADNREEKTFWSEPHRQHMWEDVDTSNSFRQPLPLLMFWNKWETGRAFWQPTTEFYQCLTRIHHLSVVLWFCLGLQPMRVGLPWSGGWSPMGPQAWDASHGGWCVFGGLDSSFFVFRGGVTWEEQNKVLFRPGGLVLQVKLTAHQSPQDSQHTEKRCRFLTSTMTSYWREWCLDSRTASLFTKCCENKTSSRPPTIITQPHS